MNLQTTKPRARCVPGSTIPLWWIMHPDTNVRTCHFYPHDGAVALLREFVLPRMVEGGRK